MRINGKRQDCAWGRTVRRALVGWMCVAGLWSGVAAANEPVTLDEFMKEFGWDFDTAEITVEKLNDEFYVLFGLGGNIAASIGDQGTMIVDDQFPQMMPKIVTELKKLGSERVDFAINTHWHFDHAEGNLALGPMGTWLVSHSNSREMMREPHLINLVAMQYEQQAYPADALPVITFDEAMQFHFNGGVVDLVHAGPAHTTGDTAVIFRKYNAVHLGDVFNRAYPFIDAGNGGSISGLIAFCRAVLGAIDEDTIVIPGHGQISDYQGLARYIEMLESVRAKIMQGMERGEDLDTIAASKPTADYDEEFGDPAQFINRAYHSLKAEGIGQ